MSNELREFLTSKGVASSYTTSYNPTCNSQVEKRSTMALYGGQLQCLLNERVFRQNSRNWSYQMHCIQSVLFYALQQMRLLMRQMTLTLSRAPGDCID